MTGRACSRRTLLKGAGVLAAGGFGWAALNHGLTTEVMDAGITVERFALPVAALPSAFDGYRIGFVTDIHFGMWVPESWIVHALDLVRTEGVDLLLLGGDYILVEKESLWRDLGLVRNRAFLALPAREQPAALMERFDHILASYSFPDGIAAVPGNHDHWNSTPALVQNLGRQSSARLLRNEELSVVRAEQRLTVFGSDDFLTGIPIRPPRAAPQGSEVRVILTHNPDYVAALNSEAGVRYHLALCGHTHGGQVRVPGLGALAAQVKDRRFVAGRTETEQGTVYTSRGLGFVGIPFRVNCPPEVTIVELRAA